MSETEKVESLLGVAIEIRDLLKKIASKPVYGPCSACDGTGKSKDAGREYEDQECYWCKGSGQMLK